MRLQRLFQFRRLAKSRLGSHTAMKFGGNIGQVNDSLSDSRLVDEARVLALRAI